jgi:hypothetical protein
VGRVAEKFKPHAAGVVAEKLKHGTGGHHSHKFSTTRPPRHNGKNISKALLSKYLELISTAPLTSFPFSTAPLPKYVFPDFFISFSSLELISSTHKATKAARYAHGTTRLLQERAPLRHHGGAAPHGNGDTSYSTMRDPPRLRLLHNTA